MGFNVGNFALSIVEARGAAELARIGANLTGGNINVGVPLSGGRAFINARPDQPQGGLFGGLFNGGGYNQRQSGPAGILQDMIRDLGQAADVDGRNLEKNAQQTFQQGLEFANKFVALAPNGVLTLNQPFEARANGQRVYIAPGNYSAESLARTVLSQANVESPETIDAVGAAIQQVVGARGGQMTAGQGQATAPVPLPTGPQADAILKMADDIKAASLQSNPGQASNFMADAISGFNGVKDASGKVTFPAPLTLGLPDGTKLGVIPPGQYTMQQLTDIVTQITPGNDAVEQAVRAAAAAQTPAAATPGPAAAAAPTGGFMKASATSDAGGAGDEGTPAATTNQPAAARAAAINYGAVAGMPPVNQDQVTMLQNAMIAAGAELPKHGADGKWGPETQRAFLKIAGPDAGKIDFTNLNDPETKAFLDRLAPKAASAAQPPVVIAVAETPAPAVALAKAETEAVQGAPVDSAAEADKIVVVANKFAVPSPAVPSPAAPSELFASLPFAAPDAKSAALAPLSLAGGLPLPSLALAGVSGGSTVNGNPPPASTPSAVGREAVGGLSA